MANRPTHNPILPHPSFRHAGTLRSRSGVDHPSFEALNAGLEERCRARQNERTGRHEQTTVKGSLRTKQSCAINPRWDFG